MREIALLKVENKKLINNNKSTIEIYKKLLAKFEKLEKFASNNFVNSSKSLAKKWLLVLQGIADNRYIIAI